MKVSIVVVVTGLLLAVAGCSKYRMDVQIKNAAPNLGRDVMTVCDTCGEHSACGGRERGFAERAGEVRENSGG